MHKDEDEFGRYEFRLKDITAPPTCQVHQKIQNKC